MKLLILTPEAELYAMTAIAIYAMSCASLAGRIHARWLGSAPVAFLPVYVALMALVAASAVLLLDVPSVTAAPPWSVVAMSIPVGVVAGAAAKWAGSAIKRLAHGRAVGPRRSPRFYRGAGSAPFIDMDRATPLGMPQPFAATVMPRQESRGTRWILGFWILAGSLEEVLFRGVLVDLALGLPSWPLVSLLLMAGLAAFAFSHLTLGWREVLDKLPLGIIALVVTLSLRSIVPAVVAHVFFNVRVWKETVGRQGSGSAAGPGIFIPRASH